MLKLPRDISFASLLSSNAAKIDFAFDHFGVDKISTTDMAELVECSLKTLSMFNSLIDGVSFSIKTFSYEETGEKKR